jgi:HSP20 family molecular chaperone IbpA
MTRKTRDPKGPTGFEALNQIGLRLGDLFGAVNATINEAASLRKGKADGGESDPLRTHVDWNVSVGGVAMGGGSGFASEDAGTRAERPQAPTPEAPPREPVHEIFVEADHVLCTFELPGVALEDVALSRAGQTLSLQTTGKAKFRLSVELPKEASAAEPARALRHGILELRFALAGV